MYYDFSSDIENVRLLDPRLADNIFYAINHHKPFPPMPACVKQITIKATTSFDFCLIIRADKFLLTMDRDGAHCLTYSNQSITVQINERVGAKQYCWATCRDIGSEYLHHMTDRVNCKTQHEMTMRALKGDEAACYRSAEFLNALYDFSSLTTTGHRFAKYGSNFNLPRYMLRKLFNRYFGKKNKIWLK